MELAERYTWITYSEYQKKVIENFNKFDPTRILQLKTAYIFPIIKPKDEDLTKSGHFILYSIKSVKPFLKEFKHINFEFVEDFSKLLPDAFAPKDDEVLILVDDYIGSGETLQATLAQIFKNPKIEARHLIILSIAGQADTLRGLKENGIEAYTSYPCTKGISDYYKEPELQDRTAKMVEIEKLIMTNRFNFGYNQSEALITLMRTPNNTFPIFWATYKKNNTKYTAPFARY